MSYLFTTFSRIIYRYYDMYDLTMSRCSKEKYFFRSF